MWTQSSQKQNALHFQKKKVNSRKVAPIMLNKDPLPWVADVKHVLQCDNKMTVDSDQKRGKLIPSVKNSIMLIPKFMLRS